jgi:hypothetical protein
MHRIGGLMQPQRNTRAPALMDTQTNERAPAAGRTRAQALVYSSLRRAAQSRATGRRLHGWRELLLGGRVYYQLG